MKVILSVPDEGYFERTWWRLFWAYLMKVIPEAGRAHLIWYLCFYSAIVMTNLQTRYHKSISLNSMLLLCFNVSIKYSCSPCVIVCFVCLTSHVSLLDMYVSYFSLFIIVVHYCQCSSIMCILIASYVSLLILVFRGIFTDFWVSLNIINNFCMFIASCMSVSIILCLCFFTSLVSLFIIYLFLSCQLYVIIYYIWWCIFNSFFVALFIIGMWNWWCWMSTTNVCVCLVRQRFTTVG